MAHVRLSQREHEARKWCPGRSELKAMQAEVAGQVVPEQECAWGGRGLLAIGWLRGEAFSLWA